MKQLLEMDFEELITVSVASKREEDLKWAPGVITVVTADDIRRFGARNLRDDLNRLSSFQAINNAFIHDNTTTVRGQSTSKDDNHILISTCDSPWQDHGESQVEENRRLITKTNLFSTARRRHNEFWA